MSRAIPRPSPAELEPPDAAHPLWRDAVALGLPEELLVFLPALGTTLPAMLGPLQASRLSGDGGHETLDASIELDAAELPGVGPRSRFAVDLRLAVARDGRVATVEVEMLQWRDGSTLFAPVPRVPCHGHGLRGAAGSVADAVLAWLSADAALPALAMAARAGAAKAERDAAVTGSAASWSLAAASRTQGEPGLHAHHLWWAVRREEEARRHSAAADFLRDLSATIAARLHRAARSQEA